MHDVACILFTQICIQLTNRPPLASAFILQYPYRTRGWSHPANLFQHLGDAAATISLRLVKAVMSLPITCVHITVVLYLCPVSLSSSGLDLKVYTYNCWSVRSEEILYSLVKRMVNIEATKIIRLNSLSLSVFVAELNSAPCYALSFFALTIPFNNDKV